MRNLLLFFIFGIFFVTSCKEPEKISSKRDLPQRIFPDKKFYETADKIDNYFKSRNKRGLFNGAALFAKGDTVVYETAMGYADFRKREKLNLNSKFQLASVSKPITAYAVMLLKHKGMLSYEDSLQTFFPKFPYPGITVHHLLTHRSGLPEYFYFADSLWQDKKNIPLTNEDVLDILYNHRPPKYYLPGKRYNYSNTNYALLALIIERVSGEKYEVFLNRELFAPLKMIDTEVYNKTEEPFNHNKVRGYIKWRRRAENTYLNGVVGDKGIYSTVLDLYKFDRALAHGTLIPLEELEKAYMPYHKELYSHDNYGYGWRINTLPGGGKIIHHTGWWKGFRSYFIRSLKDDKTIIVLSNLSDRGVFYSTELMSLFDIKWN